MEEWIFNASPLILLGKIGRLHIIESLNSAYAIPSAVADEINAGPENDPARRWLSEAHNKRRLLETLVIPPQLLAWDLGAGETAVIAHCIEKTGRRAVRRLRCIFWAGASRTGDWRERWTSNIER